MWTKLCCTYWNYYPHTMLQCIRNFIHTSKNAYWEHCKSASEKHILGWLGQCFKTFLCWRLTDTWLDKNAVWIFEILMFCLDVLRVCMYPFFWKRFAIASSVSLHRCTQTTTRVVLTVEPEIFNCTYTLKGKCSNLTQMLYLLTAKQGRYYVW